MNGEVPPEYVSFNRCLPAWAIALDTLLPAPLAPVTDIEVALEAALHHPVGLAGPAMSMFHSGERVAIVVPDATRSTGLHRLLPALIRHLETRGIAEKDIDFFFALGVHRPTSAAEQAHILGPAVYERFQARCYNHDAHDDENLVYVGRTARDTEVYLNQHACECDRLILTGSVVPHYFAGFGGGRKTLVPGLAGAVTIAQNHTLNLHPTEPRLDPAVRVGTLDGNPVAEDLLEAARLHPPDFILNTVLNADGEIGGLFAGELNAAHRAACDLAARVYCLPVQERADLVVAAVADAPNFVQSHKALVNACASLEADGVVVLYAPAPEGLGSEGYRHYLALGNPENVIGALRKKVDINGQTALSTLQKGSHTILVTTLPEREVRLLGAEKADTLAAALERARERLQTRGITRPTCRLMPKAGLTVPFVRT